MAGKKKVPSTKRRRALREALWPGLGEYVWSGEDEVGWAPIPRVMPIILRILDEKLLSGDMDLSRVYLGLWCDNYGEGIVEVANESSYAEAAGLRGVRGTRSWRERVFRLERLGFVRAHKRGNSEIGFVAIMHPYAAMTALRSQGLVDDGWWGAYQKRLIEVGAAPLLDVPF